MSNPNQKEDCTTQPRRPDDHRWTVEDTERPDWVRRRGYDQLLEIQDVIHKACTAKDVPLDLLAQLARSWDVLEERKRIIRMVPKPKDQDVSPEGVTKLLRRMRDGQKLIELESVGPGIDPSTGLPPAKVDE